MTCVHCGGSNVQRMRNIITNGDSQVFDWCLDCDKNANGNAAYLKRSETGDPEQYPVKENYLKDAPRCVKCGERGAEYHHWYPQHIDARIAQQWPGDYLCRKCHSLWHETMIMHILSCPSCRGYFTRKLQYAKPNA